MEHPHVEQVILWLGRTVLNDLAATFSSTISGVVENVESYSGINDAPVSPYVRYEYGLYFISIAGANITNILYPQPKK